MIEQSLRRWNEMEFKNRWSNTSSARGGNLILSAEIVIFPQLSFSLYVGVAMTKCRSVQYWVHLVRV